MTITVNPLPRFAYVANGGTASVSAYAIQAGSGTLTPVGAPVPAGSFPYSVTVDPSGRHAYFIKDGGFSQVLTYGIDAASGALTSLSTVGTGTTPRNMTLDPSGRFAFVANYAGNSLSTYSVDPVSGALTASPSSPVALTGGTAPLGVAVTGTIR